MKHLHVLLCVTSSFLLIAGCANNTTKSDALNASHGSGKLAVAQAKQGQVVELVFCEDGNCPSRSSKKLAVPAPSVARVSEPPASTNLADSSKVAIAPRAYTVHFLWGWSRLDREGNGEVQKIVDSLPSLNVQQVIIAGRTDPTGSRRFNEKLAIKRAETVKAALVAKGIPASVIETKSQTPCCDGDLQASAAVMKSLRRTDIELTITTK